MTTTKRHTHRSEARLALKLVSVRGVATEHLLHLPPEGRGMAQALALCEPAIGAARWQAAEKCRISWRGDAWLLSNHSRRTVCALNGRRIDVGEHAALEIGDILEFDLLRFHLIEYQATRLLPNPFDALGIEQCTRSAHNDFRAEQVADPLQLLGRLDDEFVAAVRDPMQLVGHVDWLDMGPKSGEAAPTLDELSVQASKYPALRDLVQERISIDSVIDTFDDFGGIDLSLSAIQPDILRLFAPEIPHRSVSQLPGITRREHHALSIDSAMALGRFRPGDDRTDA